MSMDKRERPWPKLRVIVEVTVPPTCRATEKDLLFHVEQAMPNRVKLARSVHANAYDAAVRVKCFKPFWPWFLRRERGLSIKTIRKERKEHDPNNGL